MAAQKTSNEVASERDYITSHPVFVYLQAELSALYQQNERQSRIIRQLRDDLAVQCADQRYHEAASIENDWRIETFEEFIRRCVSLGTADVQHDLSSVADQMFREGQWYDSDILDLLTGVDTEIEDFTDMEDIFEP